MLEFLVIYDEKNFFLQMYAIFIHGKYTRTANRSSVPTIFTFSCNAPYFALYDGKTPPSQQDSTSSKLLY